MKKLERITIQRYAGEPTVQAFMHEVEFFPDDDMLHVSFYWQPDLPEWLTNGINVETIVNIVQEGDRRSEFRMLLTRQQMSATENGAVIFKLRLALLPPPRLRAL
ncbi:MAG: hypothetical protein MUC42_07410 [Bryobacter sp.]|jgi:hypothetical protein|nr:hypothetical protein [Bryobacter sp.]